MRLSIVAIALFLAALAAGCAPQHQAASGGGHPDLIVVREFAFSPAVVTLDRTLGFSLYRGRPGASPRARADTVGRAAAFVLAHRVAVELRSLGYDAVRSNEVSAEPGGRALIVSGAFRRIYEGRRHFGASVAVAVQVDAQTAGAAPQRLAAFGLDSRTAPPQPMAAGEIARSGVNLAAERVGAAIARYVADLARRNRWPAR